MSPLGWVLVTVGAATTAVVAVAVGEHYAYAGGSQNTPPPSGGFQLVGGRAYTLRLTSQTPLPPTPQLAVVQSTISPLLGAPVVVTSVAQTGPNEYTIGFNYRGPTVSVPVATTTTQGFTWTIKDNGPAPNG